jgi:hypothetical protein
MPAMQTALSRTQGRCTAFRWRSSRRTIRPVATFDPDNLYKAPPAEGLIARRLLQKQVQSNKELAALVAQTQDIAEQTAIARRMTRTPPADNDELVEYFLNTMAEDMEYEVARCRPQLNTEFFRQLDKRIGNERFATPPDEEVLAELETLRDYLTAASAYVDKTIQQTTSAVDRMKKLLGSKDKKACILEMAEANEIDQPLIDLLRQNAAAARLAGQEDAAKFMEKVMAAASKYIVTIEPEKMANPMDAPKAAVAVPTNLGKRAPGTTSSGLIL